MNRMHVSAFLVAKLIKKVSFHGHSSETNDIDIVPIEFALCYRASMFLIWECAEKYDPLGCQANDERFRLQKLDLIGT